jgi:hypothetical protein
MSQLDYAQGDPLLAPLRIGYNFHVVYIEIFVDPVAYNTATFLSLSRYYNSSRSHSPITLMKGPC